MAASVLSASLLWSCDPCSELEQPLALSLRSPVKTQCPAEAAAVMAWAEAAAARVVGTAAAEEAGAAAAEAAAVVVAEGVGAVALIRNALARPLRRNLAVLREAPAEWQRL